jgi:hypothetical protein
MYLADRRQAILWIVETLGEWLPESQIDSTVQAWYDTGFRPYLIAEFIRAGCCEAQAAAKLHQAGITPNQVSVRDENGYTIAEKFCRNDFSLSDVIFRVAV